MKYIPCKLQNFTLKLANNGLGYYNSDDLKMIRVIMKQIPNNLQTLTLNLANNSLGKYA